MIRRDERGAAAVEMAVMALFLITLAIGIVELSLAAYTRTAVREAAQDAAIYAAYNPGDPAGAQQRALEASSRVSLEIADIMIECPANGIRVTITHDHDYLTDFLDPVLGGTLNMTQVRETTRFSTDACVTS